MVLGLGEGLRGLSLLSSGGGTMRGMEIGAGAPQGSALRAVRSTPGSASKRSAGAEVSAEHGREPAREPARSAAGSRRVTLRLAAPLARRLDACCARHPGTPRATLLLQLLESGLRQAEGQPTETGASAQRAMAPLPHRRLRGQAAVYLPASPYAALHGLRPLHHLALEQALDAALEGEGGEPGTAPGGSSTAAALPGVPACPDYRLDPGGGE